MSPHLLLLTDSFPHANGGGISQTLYNLLKNYPGRITTFVFPSEQVPAGSGILPSGVQLLPSLACKPVKNRFGRILNPLVTKFNLWALQQSLRKWPGWHLAGRQPCFFLVSTTVPEKLLVAAEATNRGYRVIPYFMDDWMDGNTLKWPGNNLFRLVGHLLRQAPARLMISRQLNERLVKRYQLPEVPTLVVHNPCMAFPPDNAVAADAGLMVYAGSVWPMHADALVALAQAVHLLQAQGFASFRLHIFCPVPQWQQYRASMEGQGVSFRGFKPYDEVRRELPKAWMLVCTASFLKQYQPFTASSVQTKLTDYISAGRPVLAIAPAGAASGQWVQEHDCGYWFQDNNPHTIAQQLRGVFSEDAPLQQKAEKGRMHAAGIFQENNVQQKLFAFLQEQVALKENW